jgi:hypothetical protein
MDSDSVFWDRLADMPAWGAEQECVLRRESNALQIAMLQRESAKIIERCGVRTKEVVAIGSEISGVMGQMTKLNERIKYLRRVNDACSWRRAVTALYGADAFNECRAWIVAEEASAMREAPPV